LGHPTAEFGAFDVKLIAQGPQEGHFRLDIEAVVFTVDVQFHVDSLHGEGFAIHYVVISGLKQPD
jgi:hypothetical protein